MSEKRKNWLVFIFILILVIFSLLVVIPRVPKIIPFSDWFTKQKIHLGLDLQGGASLLYQADVSQVPLQDRASALEGVRDVIERRINIFGVTEPVVQVNKIGEEYRLIVELPGIKNLAEAIKMIGETPYLDFRELKEGKDGTNVMEDFQYTGLTGKQLKYARVDFDPNTGEPEVSLEFDEEGKKLFAEITKRNVGKPVAIFLDNFPISIPVVQEEIPGGRARITGEFDLKEAKELAQRLQAGALPVPIKLISQQTIGPTLGRISLQKSLIAGFIGFLLIILFMIFYYKSLGIFAAVSLIIYTLIVLMIFKLIPVTLTLAGVAGFILSLGIAVDANILIFERIKEELLNKKTLSLAIEEGFRRAWSSIRDANLTTLIACCVLYYFGTSLIRGFGLTLGIGVLVSMFTAIIATKTLLRLCLR